MHWILHKCSKSDKILNPNYIGFWQVAKFKVELVTK